jgi:DsbC/DsbD-like thiol-disulfide interchange protein
MRLIIFILLCFSSYVSSQETIETAELKASLISSCDSIPKNGNFSVGVLFDLKPDWHLYWTNPGDAGLAPKIQWRTPTNISTGDIQWAFPHAMELDGISSLGYADQLLLPVTMQAKNINQQQIEIVAETSWLVCKDICIPGKVELKKTVSVTDSCRSTHHETLFSTWKEKIPLAIELLDGSVSLVDKKFQLELYLKQPIFRNATSVDIFIENAQVVSYQPSHTQRWKHNWIIWTQDLNDGYTKMPTTIYAVIVVDHKQSYRVTLSTNEENAP